MTKVKLGDVAREYKETCKGSKAGFPIVGLEHIIPREIKLTMWDEEKENTFTKMFRKGQVLFGRRRAYLKKAAVAPFNGICSGDITVIEAIHDKLLPELLPFIIQNDSLFGFAVSNSAGSLSPRVKWEHLKNYEFNLPDMKEQEKIAALLWAADDAKEAYNKLMSLTDDLVKSQFTEMFGDCKRVKIGDLCEIKARIGWQGLTKKEYLTEGVYHLITGVDFKENRIDFDRCFFVTKERYDQDDNIKVRIGDVLVTKDGTIGKVAIVDELDIPATLNSGVFVVRDKKGVLDSWFLLHSLLSDDFAQFIDNIKTGSTIAHLNQGAFINYEIPLPSIELQNQFADIVKQIDKLRLELQQTISNHENTVKSLMKQYIG